MDGKESKRAWEGVEGVKGRGMIHYKLKNIFKKILNDEAEV